VRLEAEAAAKKRAAKLAAPSGARCEAAPPSAPAAAQKDSSALAVLEVGVGGGKSARLPVHAGDIPAVIAAKFASEHGLPAAYQQKLVATIEQQLARVAAEGRRLSLSGRSSTGSLSGRSEDGLSD